MLAALVQYGATIEKTRIAVRSLLDAIDRDIASPMLFDQALEAVETSGREIRALARGGDPLGQVLESSSVNLLPELYEEDVSAAVRNAVTLYLTVERASLASQRSQRDFDTALEVATASIRDEWATLRPLLDDILPMDVVEFLRCARHDTLHFLNAATFAIERCGSTPRERRAAAHDLRAALQSLDDFATSVAALRRRLRDGRIPKR